MVDDDPDTQLIYRLALEDAGFEVTIAQDGEVAIQLVNERPPDLVVMDIVLPRLNGWSAIAAMRASETTRDVPILVVTADVPRSIREQAIALGCSGFLVKPVTPSEFLVSVRDILGLS